MCALQMISKSVELLNSSLSEPYTPPAQEATSLATSAYGGEGSNSASGFSSYKGWSPDMVLGPWTPDISSTRGVSAAPDFVNYQPGGRVPISGG